GADDFKGTLSRLEGSAYGKLWNDAALAEDVKSLRESLEKQLLKAAEESGVDREAMSWPSSAGLAVMIEVDEELGLPTPQFIFFCDWSDDAEKGAKFVESIFANMEKEASAGGAKVSFEEIRGRRVMVSPVDAQDEGEDADDGMDDEMDEFGFEEPSFGPEEICMTADKGRMFVASSKAGMDMLLGRVDGDRAKSIGDNDKFKAAVDMAGGTQDVYGVLMTEAAKPALAAFPQFMLVEPLIGQLFGNIEAWSFGVHVKDGVLEQAIGIYTPSGKKGLLALADNSTEIKAPPAIVPADAIGYGRINVSFDKVLPVLDEILGGMPAEQAEMIRPQLDIFRPAMGSAFAAMGPEIHMWSPAPSVEDPMGLESGSVTAISMRPDKDSERAVTDFINLLPLGLQSRDFNGRTILSDEFSPFAIGIGGGFMTIGSSQAVEQSMRALDAKDAGGLAADPDFLRAMANMPKNPVVGWSWTDSARQMGMLSRVLPMAAGQMGAMDIGGEGEDGFDPMMVLNLMGKITPEVAKRCMGESMLEFSSVASGYKTVWSLYPARSE
ncbi:MAG: hypothetical protein ACO3QC_12000, partial [Phycisphaerales bacterium]